MTDSREQRALLEKAAQSLEAARMLLAQGYVDFAISRAYYSMFYSAEAMLLAESLSFSRHSAVIAAFGRHYAKTRLAPEELHKWLIESYYKRGLGDYKTETKLDVTDAALQIEHAAQFIEFARNAIASKSEPSAAKEGE